MMVAGSTRRGAWQSEQTPLELGMRVGRIPAIDYRLCGATMRGFPKREEF